MTQIERNGELGNWKNIANQYHVTFKSHFFIFFFAMPQGSSKTTMINRHNNHCTLKKNGRTIILGLKNLSKYKPITECSTRQF